MRDLLQRIRARVDRLAAGVACDGPHQLTKFSHMKSGDPKPEWPPRGAAATCHQCGADLEYRHIIHVHELNEHAAG